MAIVYERMPFIDPNKYPPAAIENPRQRHRSWMVELGRAQQSVKESTMNWFPSLETQLVYNELLQTAKRGIPTTLHIDAINFLTPEGEEPVLLPQNPFSTVRRNWFIKFNSICAEIRKEGIRLNINNPPRSIFPLIFPWIGRDHRKGGSIDGRVAWLKDYNYEGKSFDMLSYSIRTEHPPTVQTFERQLQYSRFVNEAGEYIDNRPAGDLIVEIPGQPFQLLMDKGDIGRSVMLNTVLNLTKIAGPAMFASQYPISGRIARAIIKRAKQEQPTLIITSDENDPRNLTGFSGRKLAADQWEKDTKDNPYIETVFHRGNVHSKAYLVFTPKGVFGVIGTNNFNEVGIWAGTQENGIYIHEESELGSQFFDRHLEDIRFADGQRMPFEGTRFELVYKSPCHR